MFNSATHEIIKKFETAINNVVSGNEKSLNDIANRFARDVLSHLNKWTLFNGNLFTNVENASLNIFKFVKNTDNPFPNSDLELLSTSILEGNASEAKLLREQFETILNNAIGITNSRPNSFCGEYGPNDYIRIIGENFKSCLIMVLSSNDSTEQNSKMFALAVENHRKRYPLLGELNKDNVAKHFNNVVETLRAKHTPYDELQNLADELSKAKDDSPVDLYVSSKLYQEFADIIDNRKEVPSKNKGLLKQMKLTRLLRKASDIFGKHALKNIMDEIKKMNEDDVDKNSAKKVATKIDEKIDDKIEYVTGEIENANKNIDLIGKAAWDEIQQIEETDKRQEKLEQRIKEAHAATKSLKWSEWVKIKSIEKLDERDKALKDALDKVKKRPEAPLVEQWDNSGPVTPATSKNQSLQNDDPAKPQPQQTPKPSRTLEVQVKPEENPPAQGKDEKKDKQQPSTAQNSSAANAPTKSDSEPKISPNPSADGQKPSLPDQQAATATTPTSPTNTEKTKPTKTNHDSSKTANPKTTADEITANINDFFNAFNDILKNKKLRDNPDNAQKKLKETKLYTYLKLDFLINQAGDILTSLKQATAILGSKEDKSDQFDLCTATIGTFGWNIIANLPKFGYEESITTAVNTGINKLKATVYSLCKKEPPSEPNTALKDSAKHTSKQTITTPTPKQASTSTPKTSKKAKPAAQVTPASKANALTPAPKPTTDLKSSNNQTSSKKPDATPKAETEKVPDIPKKQAQIVEVPKKTENENANKKALEEGRIDKLKTIKQTPAPITPTTDHKNTDAQPTKAEIVGNIREFFETFDGILKNKEKPKDAIDQLQTTKIYEALSFANLLDEFTKNALENLEKATSWFKFKSTKLKAKAECINSLKAIGDILKTYLPDFPGAYDSIVKEGVDRLIGTVNTLCANLQTDETKPSTKSKNAAANMSIPENNAASKLLLPVEDVISRIKSFFGIINAVVSGKMPQDEGLTGLRLSPLRNHLDRLTTENATKTTENTDNHLITFCEELFDELKKPTYTSKRINTLLENIKGAILLPLWPNYEKNNDTGEICEALINQINSLREHINSIGKITKKSDPPTAEQSISSEMPQVERMASNNPQALPTAPTLPRKKPSSDHLKSNNKVVKDFVKPTDKNPKTTEVTFNTKRFHIRETDADTKNLRVQSLKKGLDNCEKLLNKETNSLNEKISSLSEKAKGRNSEADKASDTIKILPLNLLDTFCDALKKAGVKIDGLTTNDSERNWVQNISPTLSDLMDIKKATKKAPNDLKNSDTTLYLCWIALIAYYIETVLSNNPYKFTHTTISQVFTSCDIKLNNLKASSFGHSSTISNTEVKKSALKVLEKLKSYAETYIDYNRIVTTNAYFGRP